MEEETTFQGASGLGTRTPRLNGIWRRPDLPGVELWATAGPRPVSLIAPADGIVWTEGGPGESVRCAWGIDVAPLEAGWVGLARSGDLLTVYAAPRARTAGEPLGPGRAELPASKPRPEPRCWMLFLWPDAPLENAPSLRAAFAAVPRRIDAPLLAAVLRRTTPMFVSTRAGASELQQALASIVRTVQSAPASPAKIGPSSPAVSKGVREARAFLERSYAERPTVERIAAHVDLSPFHLERVFRDRYGIPVHAYLTKVRVARALDLLRTGTRPGHIATSVGFADQAHMTRVFRRELGITPGDARMGCGQDLRPEPRFAARTAEAPGQLTRETPARG